MPFKPFHKKPVNVEAVVFDGTNGRAIVEKIKSDPNAVESARNGGRYLKLIAYDESRTVRIGDVIVRWEQDDKVTQYTSFTPEVFQEHFSEGKVTQKVTTKSKRK